MTTHLDYVTGRFVLSEHLVPAGNQQFYHIYDGDFVLGETLVPGLGGGGGLFLDASLDLNFAENLSLVDDVSGNNLVTFSRASSGTYVGSDGLIKTAVADAPRFDHDPVTGESLGLLIEEGRTNLLTYSEQFDVSPWVYPGTSIVVTPDQATAPDGTLTADLVTNTASGNQVLYQAVPVVGSTTYAFSFWAKNNGGTRADYRILSPQTGEIVPINTSYFNQLSDTEFRRITVTFTTPSAATSIYVYTMAGTNVPANAYNIYIWGAQLETGSFPTSYIPTTGSTVTRATDVASITGTNFSSWYNQSEGTVFSSIRAKAPAGVYVAGAISDNTPDNRIYFGANNSFNCFVASGGAQQFRVDYNPYVQGVNVKHAAGLAQNDMSWCVSGVVRGSATTCLMPINVDRYYLNANEVGADIFSGHIARLAYFPTRKTDQELIKITDGTLDPAIITYGITSAGGTFNLLSTDTVDYAVDWDSTGGYEESTLNTLPHTYTAGDYDLVVYSDGVYRPYFNNVTADVSQITSVAIGSGADLGTSLANAWYGASNMTTFACPFSVTSLVTNFSQTWRSCRTLTSFPLIDTSSVTSFDTAWRDCTNLTSFPLIDTSSVTSFNNAWRDCTNLTSFPLIDTSSNTDFRGAWRGCTNLTSFPLLDTSSGTAFGQTWYNCTSLTSFPLLDVSSGTTFFFAWRDCSSLASFPANMFDTTGTLIATAFSSAWFGCALTAQSMGNILVSLDTNGATGITLSIAGGTNAGKSTWTAAANTAYNNLIVKGWTIYFNA